jgi:hypothetical protein
VKLTLKDGRVVAAGRDIIKGSPQQPMSDEKMRAKLRGCLEFGLDATPAQADRLAEAVHDVEDADDAAATLLDAFPEDRVETV